MSPFPSVKVINIEHSQFDDTQVDLQKLLSKICFRKSEKLPMVATIFSVNAQAISTLPQKLVHHISHNAGANVFLTGPPPVLPLCRYIDKCVIWIAWQLRITFVWDSCFSDFFN